MPRYRPRPAWLLLVCTACFSACAVATRAPDTVVTRRAEEIVHREIPADGPGVAVLIASGERVIYRAARGRADVELAVPLDPGHVFRIASITKTFVAATILKLVADGRLSLDDPLSRFVPRHPGGDAISIAQLLDHTAGVSDQWDVDPARDLDTSELLQSIAGQPGDFAPGTEWGYSNSGYILLGAVIESVTGKPWHAAVRDLILDPANLSQTGYYGDSALVYGRVLGYSRDAAGAIVRPPYASMSGPAAAGSFSSTVDDLFHFMRALTTGRILPAYLYELMITTREIAISRSFGYGFGVMFGTVRGEAVIEHNGGIEGFTAQLTYFPAQQVTVVVLANSDAGPANARSIAHRLGALAIGKPYPDRRSAVLDLATLDALTGVYQITSLSAHTLFALDGRLFIRRDSGPVRELAGTTDGILFFPGDETDYYQIIRGDDGSVTALDFYGDGLGPPRREMRVRPP